MDADAALKIINDELLRNGQPPVTMTEEQSRRAFASLRSYAAKTRRPLDVAARDVARHQLRTRQIQRSM
jgi:hypothetical protein